MLPDNSPIYINIAWSQGLLFVQLHPSPIMLGVINLIFQHLSPQTVVLFGLTSFILVHVIPYLLDPHRIRKYPGPFFAKFTDAWLGLVCKDGHRSEVVHQMHLKYGAWDMPRKFSLKGSWLTLSLPRTFRPYCSQPPFYCRSWCSLYHLRSWKWSTQIRILWCVCIHRPWSIQHSWPQWAYPETQDCLPHIFSKKRRWIWASCSALCRHVDPTVGSTVWLSSQRFVRVRWWRGLERRRWETVARLLTL